MKRKHQRTLELIFSRPVSGSVPCREVLALFQEIRKPVVQKRDHQGGELLNAVTALVIPSRRDFLCVLRCLAAQMCLAPCKAYRCWPCCAAPAELS